MCTITFLPTGTNSFLLASNRDESKTREGAQPPGVHYSGEARALWPVDTRAGGTWIALNEHGFAFALMNEYQGTDQSGDQVKSRGKIIPAIADCKTNGEVSNRLEVLQDFQFNPFRLLMASAQQGVCLWRYDGQHLEERLEGYGAGIWVSAGREESRILASRREVFERYMRASYTDNLARIKDLHTSREPEPGPAAISMELEQVQTVSATIAEYRSEKTIRMHYMAGLPSPEKKWQVCAI